MSDSASSDRTADLPDGPAESWAGTVALPDGRVLPIDTPVARADDGAMARGDGCFETLLVVDGGIRDLPEHLARLRRSAAALDLAAPADEQWLSLITAVLASAPPVAEVVLRLQLGRGAPGTGESWWATAGPVPAVSVRQRSSGVRVVSLESGHDPAVRAASAPWLLRGAKTLSYAVNMAALRHVSALGVDDALFTAGGWILEGPRSSVVLAAPDGTLVSPPATDILDGITVGRLLAAAVRAGRTVQRRPIAVAELATAHGLWLTSSVRLLAEVRELDGRAVPPSPVTATLAALLEVPGR